MNLKESEKAIEKILTGLKELSVQVPKQLDAMKKTLSKEDIRNVSNALKDSDFKKKMDQLNIAQKDFAKFMKRYAR